MSIFEGIFAFLLLTPLVVVLWGIAIFIFIELHKEYKDWKNK